MLRLHFVLRDSQRFDPEQHLSSQETLAQLTEQKESGKPCSKQKGQVGLHEAVAVYLVPCWLGKEHLDVEKYDFGESVDSDMEVSVGAYLRQELPVGQRLGGKVVVDL